MSTRAMYNEISFDRKGRRLQRMSLEQRAMLRRSYIAHIPRWRRPTVGYVMALPLIGGVAYSFGLLHQMLDMHVYFFDTLMVLPVLFVALLWGVGPALFSLCLSTLMLGYLFAQVAGLATTNIGQLGEQLEQLGIQLLPFLISGLIIAIIIDQRERAHLQALAAEQELQSYATHLEEVNEKLEDAHQIKDRFISMASHELKTPITAIRGQAQLALRQLAVQKDLPPDMEQVRTALEKVNDQTRRLTSLIDDLLDASSIRAGKIDLDKHPCDLRDICGEVIEDQRLLTGRHIGLDVPQVPVVAMVDRDRLSQVIVNLVSNAVKYSPEGTPIEVCVSQQDGCAYVQVRDHGKGIAKDQLERIFETFYRTPEAESSRKRGLGLGLAICKEIVERHGGHIWCESTKGKGSSFFVELPVK